MKVSGNPAAQLWKKVMSQVHADLPNKDFDMPSEEVVTRQYCRDSGLLAGEFCPNDARGNRVVSGRFLAADAPTQTCDLHVPVYLCKDSPVLDANGEPTGMYHLAGEYCPVESKVSVAVLDYVRDTEGLNASIRDTHVLKSTVDALGPCTVHTTPPTPEPPAFDPSDPSTWPWGGGETDDPNEKPDDGWHWPWESTPAPSDEPAPTDGAGTSPEFQ